LLAAALLRSLPLLDNRFHPDEALYAYFARLIASARPDQTSADYRFYGKARQHLEAVEYAHLYEDVLLFGDIERVIERITVLREELGITYLLTWMNFGGLESELARDSLRRFAEKVIPRFR